MNSNRQWKEISDGNYKTGIFISDDGLMYDKMGNIREMQVTEQIQNGEGYTVKAKRDFLIRNMFGYRNTVMDEYVTVTEGEEVYQIHGDGKAVIYKGENNTLKRFDKFKYVKELFSQLIAVPFNNVKTKRYTSVALSVLYYENDRYAQYKKEKAMCNILNNINIHCTVKNEKQWKRIRIRGIYTDYLISEDGIVIHKDTKESINGSDRYVYIKIKNKNYKVDTVIVVKALYGIDLYEEYKVIDKKYRKDGRAVEINIFGDVRYSDTKEPPTIYYSKTKTLKHISVNKGTKSLPVIIYETFIGKPYNTIKFKDGNRDNLYIGNLYYNEERVTIASKEESIGEYLSDIKNIINFNPEDMPKIIDCVRGIIM